ncbi:MAG: hypothetical protein AAB521_00105 [Patescibacteria group bacterium]
MKELIEIKDYYEKLAETNPKMRGMVVQLEGAINLNETVHGPQSIHEPILSSERSEMKGWDAKLVDFFSRHVPHGSFSSKNKLEIAKLFNAKFVEDLTDDTVLLNLLIPGSDPSWTSEQDTRLDRVRQIDQNFRSMYNRMIFAIRSGARQRGLSDDQITIGLFRNSTDEEVKNLRYRHNGAGKETLSFMRIALALRQSSQNFQ